ncbi:MAG: SAP domain-containing protein [Legionellaceae bacterium]|nr:SAP domain-containing protein [Legionellaceae bacterium]
MEAQAKPQTVEAIKLYISQHGFGERALPLTVTLAPDIFRQHYYDKKTLITFCRSVGIRTTGLKNDLSDRIDQFLRTGEIPQVSVYKKGGKPDSELGLGLDMPVIHYKSDLKTRAFFQKHIPEFTGFSAQVQKWVKSRLAQSDVFTYGEIVEEHKAYLKNKRHAATQGKAIKVAHDSCQFNQFQIDYAYDDDFKIHSIREAWKLVRNSAGEKKYARYKARINQIREELTRSNPNASEVKTK